MHVDRLVHGLRSRPGYPLDSTLADRPGNSVGTESDVSVPSEVSDDAVTPEASVLPVSVPAGAALSVARVPNGTPAVFVHVTFGLANVQSPPRLNVEGATPAPPPCTNCPEASVADAAHVEAPVK